MRGLADLLTWGRMGLSLGLLLCRPLSPGFYCLYLLCGATDMLDGPVARRTGSASPRGAMLDSVADRVFAAVCLVKLLPVLPLKPWLWLWTGLIAALKGLNCIVALRHWGRLPALHTGIGRAAGLLLFLLPLGAGLWGVHRAALPGCVAASLAAVWELVLLQRGECTR